MVVADWLFTLPAGIVQPLTGLWLVYLAGYGAGEPWLVVTYGLYLVALAAWVPVVRLQIRIRDMAGEALLRGESLPEAARRAFRVWFVLGWPAFIALVGVFWLMVAKPALW